MLTSASWSVCVCWRSNIRTSKTIRKINIYRCVWRVNFTCILVIFMFQMWSRGQWEEGVWSYWENTHQLPLLCPPSASTSLSLHSHKTGKAFCTALSHSFSLFLFFHFVALTPTCFVWGKYLQHKYWQWKSFLMSKCCVGKGVRIVLPIFISWHTTSGYVWSCFLLFFKHCWPTCLISVF